MGRIRTIKPDFFMHEGLAELSPMHRLFFIGLWTLVDREGRLEDRPRRIKASLFPWDDCDVNGILEDLDAIGLAHRYEANGERYLAIPTFRKHQRPHPKEVASTIPPPPSRVIKRLAVERLDPAVERFPDIPSSPAGKGREGKESWEGKEHLPPASQDPVGLAGIQIPSILEGAEPGRRTEDKPPSDRDGPGREVFDYWVAKTGRNSRTVFEGKRKANVRARLKEGYSVEDLKSAVDGCFLTPWNQGNNDTGQKHDDLELICRDPARVDRFMGNAKRPPKAGGKLNGRATDADKNWDDVAPVEESQDLFEEAG